MKAKLGRRARGWVLLLLVLNSALLVAVVWMVLAAGKRGSSSSTMPEAGDLSHALGEVSRADAAVETQPRPSEPVRAAPIRPQRTVPTAEAPVPRQVSPVPVAEPTPDTAGRATAAIIKGMRGVNAQASRPADGGGTGTK